MVAPLSSASGQGPGTRESRLLATMLNMLVAGLADPGRLSRGRTLARHGAVDDLEVEPGLLMGSVQGSLPEPYDVDIIVDPAESFNTLTALVPGRDEVEFDCTCADGDEPCKHGVALMVAFAELVIEKPSLLGLWRGQPQAGAGERAVVGSRVGSAAPAPAPPLPVAPSGLDEAAVAVLADYLGTPAEHRLEPVATLGSPAAAWGELWAEMLGDALDALADRRRSGT